MELYIDGGCGGDDDGVGDDVGDDDGVGDDATMVMTTMTTMTVMTTRLRAVVDTMQPSSSF
jgi:hypothetical protein